MTRFIFSRSASWPWVRAVLTLSLVAMTSGCSAVHSRSVKQLIAIEGDALKKGAEQADTWNRESVQQQVKAFRKSVEALDAGMKELQTFEAKYSLVAGSFQNVATKTGTDAAAFSYFAGRIYITDQDGISGEVKKQFADAEEALGTLAQQLADSWKQMLKLHNKLAEYANKSAFASVDDEFVAALVQQVPGASDRVDELLAKTKELNDHFEQASRLGLGNVPAIVQAHSVVGDLVDLLDRMKKK